MSNVKEVRGKPKLYVSFLEYGRHVGQLHRRRRRVYAPTSNTASHDSHEKFPFLSHDEHGATLGGPWGRRSSAINTIKQSRYLTEIS